MDDCYCGPGPSRRVPRMGASSYGSRAPPPYDRPLPLSMPTAPRPRSPPRMPTTVPGHVRQGGYNPDETITNILDQTIRGDSTILRAPQPERLEETLDELNKLEYIERQNVEDDLREFQKNRRKLVFNVVSLQLSKTKKSLHKAAKKLGLK
ncbi:uncharacterized protein LOC115891800 [Sitophilus oryzae]|uniref:Uncharacterized protein LOC115884712 n=1 Tax=Sitophilus oryzae TaxID=7048 RepID=A0A6J2Y5W0_SITOR|nr:uncharacterized protein LOC115884712 [Sitophilus oryzae]XP_030768219.1 uncharacterized protein LOC115891800 [Sitophilus oryzae]